MRNDNIKFKDIFWNTLGTVTYAAISLLLSVVIINVSGSIEGGIFSFGFSTLARLVYIVTFFGIRPMHIVDIKYRYSFNNYKSFGIKCIFFAFLAGSIYIFYRYYTDSYNLVKVLLLLVLICHGVIDGFSDYYECEYQRVNKLYMCGQSLFFRITAFTTTLIVVVVLTKNLLYAEIIAVIVEIVFFYIFNVCRSKTVFKYENLYDSKIKDRNLFFDALPLFLVTFMDMYIFSSAKFAIDAHLGDVYSGFFNLLFMPTNVIYLVMTLFMKPLLTPLSNAYHYDKKEYNKILINTFLLSLLISIVFLVGTLIFGNFYLDIIKFVTNNAYSNIGNSYVYRNFTMQFVLLFIVIAGGCFYTICTPMYFAIIVENKQRYLIISYAITSILSLFISRHFVMTAGLVGAAISFVISMFILFFGVIIVKALTK